MWVARCERSSAGLSAGVSRLPPAKEEDGSPIPSAGISPRAEVREEKSSGGQDRTDISGREMESFQKSAWGQDHPGRPAGTKSACVLSLVWIHGPSSMLSSPCTYSGVLPGKGGNSSAAAGWGLSSRLLTDAYVRSPSFAMRTLLAGGLLAAWEIIRHLRPPSELFTTGASALIGFSSV